MERNLVELVPSRYLKVSGLGKICAAGVRTIWAHWIAPMKEIELTQWNWKQEALNRNDRLEESERPKYIRRSSTIPQVAKLWNPHNASRKVDHVSQHRTAVPDLTATKMDDSVCFCVDNRNPDYHTVRDGSLNLQAEESMAHIRRSGYFVKSMAISDTRTQRSTNTSNEKFSFSLSYNIIVWEKTARPENFSVYILTDR